MKIPLFLLAGLVLAGGAIPASPRAAAAPEAPMAITLEAEETTIPMGDVVHLTARAERDGEPLAGCLMLPIVNGRRWGHHEYADENGEARFMIPLPNPGPHAIAVGARNVPAVPPERWIWTKKIAEQQTVYLTRWVDLNQPGAATLWVAVDDRATVWINGKQVAEQAGWNDLVPTEIPAGVLLPGRNLIMAAAHNGGGPAGFLMRLEIEGEGGSELVVSDAQWRAFDEIPTIGPDLPPPGPGEEVTHLSVMAGSYPTPWPTLASRPSLLVGGEAPADLPRSDAVNVEVTPRILDTRLMSAHDDRSTTELIGAQWESWFTPLNIMWQTAQAVPLIGFYDSHNPDVVRQHLIWMMESGVDYFMADWSNHIWHLTDWEQRSAGSDEILDTTTITLDELARLREEGWRVPRFTLLMGISHVRPDGANAVRGQLAWVYDHYVANPKYHGLWQHLHGKPLVQILDLGGSYIKEGIELDDRWTIRYTGANINFQTEEAELGMWSWMDSTTEPTITWYEGKPEAATVSVGYFGPGGWTKDGVGRRGGATLLETFRPSLRERPMVTMLHQFQEFAGQPEGLGHGPNQDSYYDSYSVELSDDFEPVSLSAPAYRGEGGWGFQQLNQIRALVDLYRNPGEAERLAVVAIQAPLMWDPITGEAVELEWTHVGARPSGWSISVNGEVVQPRLPADARAATVELGDVAPGPLVIRVTALGTALRYEPHLRRAAGRLAQPVESYAQLETTRE